MLGQIEAVNRSQSGKSLGVQVQGTWYTTKDFSLEGAVGRSIIFEPTTTPPKGNFPAMNWLNDYQFDNASSTPSGQAFDAAHKANGQGRPDKESVIGAMALVKATTGTPEQIWENFVFFYGKLSHWTPDKPTEPEIPDW